MASKSQQYTLTHTGSVLGSSMVTRSQNQVNPQRPTAVLTFECPKKFESIEYVGQRDATRFVPRTQESITGTTGDDTSVSLTADIQPVAGDTNIADQDYPVVVAFNATTGTRYDITDVDYATNSVTLGTDPANGDTVKLWPIISEGNVQMRGVNQFGQVEGHVDNWPTPIYRWHDFEQLKDGREINLDGSIEWSRYEKVEILVDSPRQIVWQDADYPDGEYVSTLEQDVTINLE